MPGVLLLSFLLAVSSASDLQDAKAPPASGTSPSIARGADRESTHWIGTWAAAAQPAGPRVQTYRNQTLRLIVHTSVGGAKIRIRISNDYGERPLLIGAAHVARRAAGADIDPTSDRAVLFQGRSSTTVPPRSMVVSDPVGLDAPALSDLAISIFLPQATEATTTHNLAKQTNYVSPADSGDHSADVRFAADKTTGSWPFLIGVDVAASPRAAAIVAFGSSLTDGDGTTKDTNRRFPDVLAERLQRAGGGKAEVGVLNEGIIGNRLLNDSPPQAAGGRFGAMLGQAGLSRFERDVLDQAGVQYVILGLGINDIVFPGSLTPSSENITAEEIIAGYRQIIARAHKKGIRIIGTTNGPFENAFLALPPPEPPITFYSSEKESVRKKVNDWILGSGEFDGVVDLDKILRDPGRPTQLRPSYDSGDHVHPNDAGAAAEGNAFPLSLFEQ
jgi:lysophospholipase L1-like esterase